MLLFGAAGCAGTAPRVRSEPPRAPLDLPPPRVPVVQAGAVQPQPQPLPVPREVPDTKLGAEPPAAPGAPLAIRGGIASTGGPLGPDEVIAAVNRHYPLLRSIEQERAVAGGRLLSATGAFDTNLLAAADGQGTTYDNFRTNTEARQLLPFGGVSVFGGYRTGTGEFTTYGLGAKTADAGEFRAGASIPLLRDRAIDRPRAAVQQARLDVALAEPTIERQRLDFHRAAARTYWNWVAAGHRLKTVEGLVALAVERDEQLKKRVEAGPVANIERVDNQQNIALRNGVLVQAQRGFQQATIELSLFLRDDQGRPTLAGADRLPAFPDAAAVASGAFDEALQQAFQNRPEPVRLRLMREKLAVELNLANNQLLPAVNAVVAASQDVGPGKSSLSGPNGLDRTTLSAGVALALPAQRSDARGRVLTALAQMGQLEQQLRQAEDTVRADVQDTFSALERAYEFVRQAEKRVELAKLVARAERAQLAAGRSDVLRVTLREQAAFDAEIVEIGARQDYFRALTDFRAALGITR